MTNTHQGGSGQGTAREIGRRGALGVIGVIAAGIALIMAPGVLFADEPAKRPAGEPRTLNVYMWSEYIDPTIVERFEREQNAKVVIDVYEDTETMLAKVQHQEGDRLYDLLVVSDHAVRALSRLKLLAKLDLGKLPNRTNVEARFLTPPYDPDGEFSLPYQWGTVGILYRKSALGAGAPAPTWTSLLSGKHEAPFFLIDSMRDMIGVALRAKGRSVNETDPEYLKAAGDAILNAKASPKCLGFDGSVGGKNKVVSTLAGMAIVYSGDGLRAASEDADLAYTIPAEGSIVWVDAMAVTARAKNAELAHAFMNFLLDAKVGAQLSNFTRFSSPNSASKPDLRSEDRANPMMYPEQAMMDKLEYLEDVGDSTGLFDELWTRVKSR